MSQEIWHGPMNYEAWSGGNFTLAARKAVLDIVRILANRSQFDLLIVKRVSESTCHITMKAKGAPILSDFCELSLYALSVPEGMQLGCTPDLHVDVCWGTKADLDRLEELGYRSKQGK